MKLPVIKKLVETYSDPQLEAAEEALLNESTPEIEVEGSDEGEQLTHVMAARFILSEMAKGADYMTALRSYTSKVRTSIS
jgi:phage-related protein